MTVPKRTLKQEKADVKRKKARKLKIIKVIPPEKPEEPVVLHLEVHDPPPLPEVVPDEPIDLDEHYDDVHKKTLLEWFKSIW